MKIFLAGATGADRKTPAAAVVRRGHTVTATTRTPDKVDSIRRVGATDPKSLNALTNKKCSKTVRRAAPDVIIHELTAIPPSLDLKRFDEGFAFTNMLS